MKNKGFTLTEVMIGTLIAMGLMAVIFSIFITLNTALTKSSVSVNLKQQAQIAIDKLQSYIEQSSPDKITIENCTTGCSGQKIIFQIPVVTNDAVSGTVFNLAGDPKWGAKYRSGSQYITVPGGKYTVYVGPGPTGQPKGLREEVFEMVSGSNPLPCFLAGTPILMADGSSKPIEEIKVGDEVLAYNEKTAATEKNKVTKLLVHDNVKQYLIINGNLKVTPEHRFYTEGKWKRIGVLKVSDKLLKHDGTTQEITSIAKVKLKEKIKVYNFAVTPSRTYFAAGFLVHNSKQSSSMEGPLGKLFDAIFAVKEAFAGVTLTKHRYYDGMLVFGADNMSLVGYPSNQQPEKISITITFKDSSAIGGAETEYSAQSEIVPRN